MQEIAKFCRQVDRCFNIAGYIPIVSSLTGLIRIVVWAQLQLYLGLLAMTIAIILAMCGRIGGDKAFAKRCVEASQLSFRISANSTLNGLRGLVEVVPLLGNLLCWLYDLTMGGEQILPY